MGKGQLEKIKLEFGVKTQAYRSADPDAALADSDFNGMRKTVLERDQWRCRACGCPSSPSDGAPSAGLQVHHLDDNHKNNDISNLATLCPLCHGIFHIGFAARTRPGIFIWLPEIPQSGLNLFVHLCAISEIYVDRLFPKSRIVAAGDETAEMSAAKLVSERLRDAWTELSKHSIPDTLFVDPEMKADELEETLASEPQAFGNMLASFIRGGTPEKLARLRKRLHGLRYLYKIEADTEAPIYAQCTAWMTGPTQAQRRLEKAAMLLDPSTRADERSAE